MTHLTYGSVWLGIWDVNNYGRVKKRFPLRPVYTFVPCSSSIYENKVFFQIASLPGGLGISSIE